MLRRHRLTSLPSKLIFCVLWVVTLFVLFLQPVSAQEKPTTSQSITAEALAIDQQQPTVTHLERILDIDQGVDVDSYSENGHIKKIVAEELGETGYIIRTFHFDHDVLIRGEVRVVGFKSYPNPSKDYETHDHLKMESGEKILSDDVYYFWDGQLIRWQSLGQVVVTRDVEFQKRQADIPASAKSYSLFMQTPSPEGSQAEDAWVCADTETDFIHCTSFKLEEQP